MPKRLYIYALFLLKLLGDVLLINCSLLFAYILKFKLYLLNAFFDSHISIVNPAAQIESYISIMYFYTLIMLAAFYLVDLYYFRYGIFAEIEELLKIIKGTLIGILSVMAFTFLYKSFPGSRTVLFYSGIFTVVLLSFYHFFIIKIQKKLRAKGVGSQSLLIIGTDETAQSLAERIIKNPSSELHLAGFVDDIEPEKISYNLDRFYRYLGKPDSLQDIFIQQKVKKIIIAKEDVSREILETWFFLCEKNKVEFMIMPDYLDLLSTTVTVSDMDGIPLIAIKNVYRTWIDDFYKRAMDTVLSLAGILLFSPVIVLFALMIKLTSSGPIIFKQERVGRNGKPFLMYKFRSMRQDAEQSGPKIVTASGDNRVTFIGTIMRKFSIDELPQLFNVLLGDMSVVGPRPERQHFIDHFETLYPGFSKRLVVKPGITGWAQINGRSALSSRIEEKLRYDLYYIENWSMGLDIKIVMKTFFKVILASEAY